MLMQPALALYPPGLRGALHIAGWLIAVATALFLPFVGFAAMRQFGRQLWPLFVGWASLALFIIYAAIASMGLFAWLPINWHLAGRSEEHTSELPSLMRISYAVFCLKNKQTTTKTI